MMKIELLFGLLYRRKQGKITN